MIIFIFSKMDLPHFQNKRLKYWKMRGSDIQVSTFPITNRWDRFGLPKFFLELKTLEIWPFVRSGKMGIIVTERCRNVVFLRIGVVSNDVERKKEPKTREDKVEQATRYFQLSYSPRKK